MSLNNVTTVNLASADTTVVWTLSTGEAVLGPAIWPAIDIEESVFLFETEPEVFLGVGFHQSGGFMAVVELVGGAIRVQGFAEDKHIVTTAERVGVNGNRTEVNIGVVTGGLTGRGTIEVPFRKL